MKIDVGCRSSMRLEGSRPENYYLLVVRRITWENRMSTSVVLSPHFEAFVQQQLASGRFNNTSEVIRAGLRLLEEQQQQFATRTLELKSALAEGMQSGQPRPAEEVFDEIEAQVRELAKSRG